MKEIARNYEKKTIQIQNIRRFANETNVQLTQHIVLKIVGFQGCMSHRKFTAIKLKLNHKTLSKRSCLITSK